MKNTAPLHLYLLLFSLASITSSGASAAEIPTFELPYNKWSMIALPATPPSSANTLKAILDNDMRDKGGDYNTNWVVYAYHADSNGYDAPLSLTDKLEKGKGYWIIQQIEKGKQVTLRMPSKSTETPNTESIPLTASRDGSNQWSLAGNPFSAPLAIGELRVSTNAPSCSNGGCNVDKAQENGLLHGKIWIYDGNKYVKKGTGDQLDPWSGFWVAALGRSVNYSLALVKASPLIINIEKVANWKGGAKAAYSIIHDDYPYPAGLQTHYRELNTRGLQAGFGVIVQPTERGQSHFSALRKMVDEGHEIINHSYSHADLRLDDADLRQEIDYSTERLRTKGFDITAFVFPYDRFNDALLQRLKNQGYLGARAGERGVNSANMDTNDPLAPFRARFDAFFEDPSTGQNTLSIYKAQGNVLKAYVDDAIHKGGWAVRELHSIEDSYWGSVSLAKYTAHLDYVADKVKSNDVWMDTFTNVNRYRSSRAYCGEALAQDGAVVFSTSTSEDCTKYATPLSVIVNTNGVNDITVTQNGVNIPSKHLDSGRHMLDIDPTAGPAYITGQAD